MKAGDAKPWVYCHRKQAPGKSSQHNMTTTARPPKITKNDSLALFVWLEPSQAFFYQDGSSNLQECFTNTASPLWRGCIDINFGVHRFSKAEDLWLYGCLLLILSGHAGIDPHHPVIGTGEWEDANQWE